MQLMPATAAAFGIRDRYEVEQNIRGGVTYLAHLIRRFGSDLRLVVAAYIAGENVVAVRGLSYSNAEVYRYVRRVRERCLAQPRNGNTALCDGRSPAVLVNPVVGGDPALFSVEHSEREPQAVIVRPITPTKGLPVSLWEIAGPEQ